MYISVPSNQLRSVEAVLRDHNVHPVEAHLPIISAVQLINIRDDQIAKNVIHRLKSLGIPVTLTSTV